MRKRPKISRTWRNIRRCFTRDHVDAMTDLGFLADANWGLGAFMEDYLLLHGIVTNLKPSRMLEIGSGSGLGALVLANASSSYSTEASVTSLDIEERDIHDNDHILKHLRDRITFMTGSSSLLLEQLHKEGQSYDLVFIDGDHSYEQAERDWKLAQQLSYQWVFHDTTQYLGLQILMEEIRQQKTFEVFQFVSACGSRKRNDRFVHESFSTGLTIVQRRKRLQGLKHHAQMDEKKRPLEREQAGHRSEISAAEGLLKA